MVSERQPRYSVVSGDSCQRLISGVFRGSPLSKTPGKRALAIMGGHHPIFPSNSRLGACFSLGQARLASSGQETGHLRADEKTPGNGRGVRRATAQDPGMKALMSTEQAFNAPEPIRE